MPATPASQQPKKRITVSHVSLILAALLFVAGFSVYIASKTATTQPAQPASQPTPEITPAAASGERVEGQVIVKFKDGVSDQQINQRLAPLNARIKSKVSGINTTVVEVPLGQEDAVIDALKNDPIVQYAESDYIYRTQFVPTDPGFAQQWSLVNTGQTVEGQRGRADADIDAELAWDVTKGAGVKVAVLDSGIDEAHPELSGRIVASRVFVTSTLRDMNGHGTHVAGIIAANANNGQGISGVCPDCQLLVGKVTNDDGTVPASAIAPSMVWAADQGAKVINMSIAGPNFSQAVEDAANYAWSKNSIIVSAAGNDGNTSRRYPAANAHVVSVANTDNNDMRDSTSNYGTWVSVSAPGTDILSTLPTTPNARGVTGFEYLTGTSMATGVVSGTTALIWASQHGTSNAAVVQRLLSTTDRISGTGSQWINGRINAGNAVAASAVTVAPPTATPTVTPTRTPTPNVPTPTGLITVVPTFVCGGSTNSVCPSPTPGQQLPTPTNRPATPTVRITGGFLPTTNPATPTTRPQNPGGQTPGGPNHPNKPNQGAIRDFVDLIMKFLLQLLQLLVEMLGRR